MTAQYVIGGPILGRGSFLQDFPEYDRETVEGYTFVPSLHDPTYVAHVAEVEVDTLTGKVRVLKYVAAQDLGYCINPLGAEGQIQGGAVQGIGYALFEEMLHDDSGLTVNPNLGEYKLPTISSSAMSSVIRRAASPSPFRSSVERICSTLLSGTPSEVKFSGLAYATSNARKPLIPLAGFPRQAMT